MKVLKIIGATLGIVLVIFLAYPISLLSEPLKQNFHDQYLYIGYSYGLIGGVIMGLLVAYLIQQAIPDEPITIHPEHTMD